MVYQGHHEAEDGDVFVKVGLYNLEPRIVNTAMMQVSQYHKEQGDIVEPYLHFEHDSYDRIYAFSLFDFTPKCYVTKDMIVGGTGFDIKSRLPAEIEDCDLDWSLYPRCPFSIVDFSIGCPNRCPFCVVGRKEGTRVKPVEPKNLNPNGKWIMVRDPNFFRNPDWREAIEQLKRWGRPVDFIGVDARILDVEMCEALLSLRHEKQIHIAWDNPRLDLVPRLKEITEIIKPRLLMCYVLIGYWSTPAEDLMRVEALRDLKIDPFAMPYRTRKPGESSEQYKVRREYMKNFARWVDHKAIFKSVKWEDYKKGIAISPQRRTLDTYAVGVS